MIYNKINGAADGKRGGPFKKSIGGGEKTGVPSLGYNPYPCNSVLVFSTLDKEECVGVLTGCWV